MRYIERLKVSEVTIQAEFYSRCKEKGFNCVLEYTHENCQFDAVVVVDKDIVAIIEMKSLSDIQVLKTHKLYKKKLSVSEQIKRYSAYGVPVLLCICKKDIGRVLYRVAKIVDAHPFTKKQEELRIKLVEQVDKLVQDFRSFFPNSLSENDDLVEFRGRMVDYLSKKKLSVIENTMEDTFEVLPKNPNRPELLFYKKMQLRFRGASAAIDRTDGFRSFNGQYISQKQCTPRSRNEWDAGMSKISQDIWLDRAQN